MSAICTIRERALWCRSSGPSQAWELADPDSANFRVRAVHGVVYLIGLAQSQAELDKALSILREYEDVRDVVSYVRIKKPGG